MLFLNHLPTLDPISCRIRRSEPWPRQTGTRPARIRVGLSRSLPNKSVVPAQGVTLAEADGDMPRKEPRLLTDGQTGRGETRGFEREYRVGPLTDGGRERGYGEAPSRAVREGGMERTRSFEEVGRDLLRGEREKNVFFSVPRRTSPSV